VLLFFGPDGSLMSTKWHNIKIWLRYSESIEKPIVTPQFPMIFDLSSDPDERNGPSRPTRSSRFDMRIFEHQL